MGKKVFVNGMEISHKAGDGMLVAAFPDVCLSPPAPPAGPVPVPYPDTSKASDLQDGTTSVMVGGKPAALMGQSYFKSSPLGNEAATRTFGASVITHEITGKTYFQACSMNVTFEGKPVCRHLDIMTSNHLGAQPGGTPPMPELESMSLSGMGCDGGEENEEEKEKKCPCCGEPKHPNQRDAEPVSEEEWYCVDTKMEAALQAEIDALEQRFPTDPNRRGEKKEVFEAKKKARARKESFEERRATLKEMRQLGCPTVPTPPGEGCGTYFKQTDEKKTQAAEKRWREVGGYKHEYKRWRAANSRPLGDGEKVNHVVPISAGGCPKGGREDEGFPNLVPDSDIQNPRCLELDGSKNPRLGRAQSQASSHWSGGRG